MPLKAMNPTFLLFFVLFPILFTDIFIYIDESYLLIVLNLYTETIS